MKKLVADHGGTVSILVMLAFMGAIAVVLTVLGVH